MKTYWTNGRAVLWQGHVLDCLAAMEAGSVHCTVTSPPYWGLRDYDLPSLEWPAVSYAPMAGLPPLDIPGCDPECGHVWGEADIKTYDMRIQGVQSSTFHGGLGSTRPATESASQYCQLCGGWRGCLGLEPTPEMFVGHIVLVARELWRVLRDDGTFWLNFGDSYFGGKQKSGEGEPRKDHSGGVTGRFLGTTDQQTMNRQRRTTGNAPGLKPKDLIGIPWRVAFALQADGWFLRSDIIWAKGVSFCPTYSGSCMPESVRDRPTTGHEHVFLLAKSKRYFYDGDAVRERMACEDRAIRESKQGMDKELGFKLDKSRNDIGVGMVNAQVGARAALIEKGGRNLRTVWTINPGSYAGAHFATFPPALVEPMIKAGTSAKGCCPECGAPWKRVTETDRTKDPARHTGRAAVGNGDRQDGDWPRMLTTTTTTGWTPTCSCGTEHPIPQEELDADPTLLDDFEIEPFEPVPCTVLDPFAGTFTTGEVADFLGRHSVGIELSEKYCLEHIIPRFTEPLFEWAAQEQQEPEPEIEQMGLL